MTDRHTASTINDQQLDELHDALDRARLELKVARDILGPHDLRLVDEMVATVEQEMDRATRAETERDGAYRERAHLVALLAAMTDGAVIAPALDLDEAGWWIVYLQLGGWQASWHISPRDAELFTRVERVETDDPRAQWDGHTPDQKYTRIRSHTRLLAMAKLPGNVEPASGPAAAQATEPDTCRPVEVDGQTIRVRGSGQFTEQDQEFAADIVRAAKRKYAAEHPEEQH